MTDRTEHVLVVANRTAASEELLDALRDRAERGPATFHLVVPASPRGFDWAANMYNGGDAAEVDLDGALARMRASGIDVDGEVGFPDPLAAVQDAANAATYDEVIVSTLPRHLSRWLKLDLPRKVAHATGLPVTHVETGVRVAA
jgi:nucleotide-binding universal stress UspA family protein